MSESILLLPLYDFMGRKGTTLPASLYIMAVLEEGQKQQNNADKICFPDEIQIRHIPNTIQCRYLFRQHAPFTDSNFGLSESIFIDMILFRRCVCSYLDTVL